MTKKAEKKGKTSNFKFLITITAVVFKIAIETATAL